MTTQEEYQSIIKQSLRNWSVDRMGYIITFHGNPEKLCNAISREWKSGDSNMSSSITTLLEGSESKVTLYKNAIEEGYCIIYNEKHARAVFPAF